MLNTRYETLGTNSASIYRGGNKHPAATHRKTPFTYLNRGRQSLLLVAGKVSCKLLGVLGLEEVHRASDGISEPIVDEVHRRAGCDRAIRAWQPIREKDPPRAASLWRCACYPRKCVRPRNSLSAIGVQALGPIQPVQARYAARRMIAPAEASAARHKPAVTARAPFPRRSALPSRRARQMPI